MMDSERDPPKDGEGTFGNVHDGRTEVQNGACIAHSSSLPPMNENADLGSALRRIYQQTVKEEIPEEMLDLLNRLT